MSRTLKRFTACAAWFAIVAASDGARAAGTERCLNAADATQAERAAGHLRAALDAAVQCANEECPSAIRKDCAAWAGEIEAALPTIAVHAIDAQGGDVVDVRVLVDGAVVRQKLDGRALVVDPGQHRMRFELKGAPPVEKTVLLSEGEQHRVINVSFAGGSRAKQGDDAGVGARPVATPETGPETSPDTGTDAQRGIAFGLLGLGAASLATFGVLELVAQGEYRTLRDGCGATKTCPADELSSTSTKFDIAKVAAAVSVVSFAVGIPLLLIRPSRSPRAAVLDATGIASGGAGLRLRGTF